MTAALSVRFDHFTGENARPEDARGGRSHADDVWNFGELGQMAAPAVVPFLPTGADHAVMRAPYRDHSRGKHKLLAVRATSTTGHSSWHSMWLTMSFCEHCAGQRFDRARVLRTLRQMRQTLRATGRGGELDNMLVAALDAVRALDIPHLEPEPEEDHVIH